MAQTSRINTQALGRALLDRRLSLDMSQTDLAIEAKVTPSMISKLERGLIGKPGADVLDRIASALGLDDWRELTKPSAGSRSSSTRESPATEPPPRAMAAPTPLGEIVGPDGQPLKPVDLGGGIIGWIPADVDPATIPPTTIEEFRRVMREELRKVLEEERAAMSERQSRSADIGEAK